MVLRKKESREPVDTIDSLSYKEAYGFFHSIRSAWEASKPCQQLRSTLLSTKTQFSCSKVVGLALGPMGYGGQGSLRAAYQHSLMLTLRDVFSEKKARPGTERCPDSRDSIVCYAQDPAYTKVDRSVLAECEISVLGNPKGFLEVDDSTVVLSCAPSVPVKQIIFDLAQPSVIIVDRILDKEPDVSV